MYYDDYNELQSQREKLKKGVGILQRYWSFCLYLRDRGHSIRKIFKDVHYYTLINLLCSLALGNKVILKTKQIN